MAKLAEDHWQGETVVALSPIQIQQLSKLKRFSGVLNILLEWSAILVGIGLCHKFFHPGWYFITLIWIGSRQHALTILAHEAAHFRLFKNKKFNDYLADLFLCWPMFFKLQSYRNEHFQHHRFINTAKDPDWLRKNNAEWKFPMPRKTLLLLLTKQLLGLNSFQLFFELKNLSSTETSLNNSNRDFNVYAVLRFAFYIGLGLCLWKFSLLKMFLMYWILPLATSFSLVYRLRSIAEHFALREGAYAQARTTLAPFWERLLIAPKNVHYHLDHHLYPGVPWYRLANLHQKLMENSVFSRHAHISKSYWQVLKECSQKRRGREG